MKRTGRVVGFAATAACLLAVSAVTLAAGGDAYEAAVNAARSEHRSAVADCNRMSEGRQGECLRDADAAREAAMIRALDLNFPPPTEGAAGGEAPPPPGKWMLPGVEPVPDNLASNLPR